MRDIKQMEQMNEKMGYEVVVTESGLAVWELNMSCSLLLDVWNFP